MSIYILTYLPGCICLLIVYLLIKRDRKKYVENLKLVRKISKKEEISLHAMLAGEYMFLFTLIFIICFAFFKPLLFGF